MKKILGTSDAWLMSCLSHRPSKPVYYIVDCRISKLEIPIWFKDLNRKNVHVAKFSQTGHLSFLHTQVHVCKIVLD